MSNLGISWTEEQINQVLNALGVQELSTQDIFTTVYNIVKTNSFESGDISTSTDTQISQIINSILPSVIGVGGLIVGGLAALTLKELIPIADLVIDIVDYAEEQTRIERINPDNNEEYNKGGEIRRLNILLGDILSCGSSEGEFIQRNSDSTYDFYSLFKPAFINKHLGRAINEFRSSSELVVRSENNDEFDFSRLSYFEDFNINRVVGRALNFGCSNKNRVVELLQSSGEGPSPEQYDFKKMWKFHAENDDEFFIYLTNELRSISSIVDGNQNIDFDIDY